MIVFESMTEGNGWSKEMRSWLKEIIMAPNSFMNLVVLAMLEVAVVFVVFITSMKKLKDLNTFVSI